MRPGLSIDHRLYDKAAPLLDRCAPARRTGYHDCDRARAEVPSDGFRPEQDGVLLLPPDRHNPLLSFALELGLALKPLLG